MNINLLNISNYADILAIPFFAYTCLYFYNIVGKNRIEYFLFICSIIGLVCDICFTYIFLSKADK